MKIYDVPTCAEGQERCEEEKATIPELLRGLVSSPQLPS